MDDRFEDDERIARWDRILGGTAWALLIITTVFLFCGGG